MSVTRIVTITNPAPAPPAPATVYDLTDLATVKSELTIADDNTADDAWFSRQITRTSRMIMQYCNRVFQVEGLSEIDYIQQDPFPYQLPGSLVALALTRWPLVNWTSLPAAATVYAGTVLPFAATDIPVVMPAVAGVGIAVGTTVESFDSASVTLTQPITAPVLQGATILFGFTLLQGVDAYTTQPLTYGQDYTIDPRFGFLYRLNPFTGVQMTWEPLAISTSYSAGYPAVPDDVQEACVELVVSRYRSRGRDPYLKAIEQPGLGIQTYWVGGPPKSGSMPIDIAALLDAYRVPVVI